MKTKIKNLMDSKLNMIILLGLLIVFGYFLLFHPVQELSDSFQYLNQFVSREPVYALLLQILQICFEANYAVALGVIQNLLAVICIYWLYKRLSILLHFSPFLKLASACILLAPHLVTPFASRSRMIITNSVLTEGIAVSLYYVWFGMLFSLLLGYYQNHMKKYTIVSLLLSVVLAMIRGQLIICILVWAIVLGFIAIRDKQYKTLLFVFLGLIVSFVGKTQITMVYNYLESGFYVNTVSSKPMLLANVVYIADKEDGADIEEDDLRKTYETIIEGINNNQLSRHYASGSLMELADFHESGHELINFEYIVPALNQYIKAKDGIDESTYFALLIKHEEYSDAIIKAVLPNVIPEFIKNYFVIASLGFVRSIAVDRSILPLYALAAYLIVLILLIPLFKHNRRSPAGYFMLLTLLLICGTVFGTSIMIECISRYMIYNFPFFYIAGLTMLIELYCGRKKG